MHNLLRRCGESRIGLALRAVLRSAGRLRADARGNIIVIFAVALPLMVGSLGLAVEGANWYETNRGVQNAADEAAVAAATNATSTYLTEAKAVSSQYGFTDGTSNVTVTASNAATCPGAVTPCYSVTITKKLPLMLMQAVGFGGNTTLSGNVTANTPTFVSSTDTCGNKVTGSINVKLYYVLGQQTIAPSSAACFPTQTASTT